MFYVVQQGVHLNYKMLCDFRLYTKKLIITMSFRLDRTTHHAGTHEQAAQYHARHQPATPAERLRAAAYLNSVAFGYDLNNPPRLDRTAFSTRKHAC